MAKTVFFEEINGEYYCGREPFIKIVRDSTIDDVFDKNKLAYYVEQGLPFEKRGKVEKIYPVGLALKFLIEKKGGLEDIQDQEKLKRINLQKDIEIKTLKKEKLTLENKIARGDYVPVKDVSQSQSELITLIKNTLMSLIGKLPNGKIKTAVYDIFKNAFAELKEKLKDIREKNLDNN